VVIDAATRCFAESGRSGTSVDEVAAAAGVRKPAIYELFGSKDDLYRACVAEAVDALRDNFRVVNAETTHLELAERTRLRVTAAVDHAVEHPHAFRLLSRTPFSWPAEDPAVGARIRESLVEVMAANYRRESTSDGRPLDTGAEVMARLFLVMTEEVVRLCLSEDTVDREPLIDFLTELILTGITGIQPQVWDALERSRREP